MIKVVLIGSGNVATHLVKAFLKINTIEVVQVYSRQKTNKFFLKKNIEITQSLTNLKNADLYIISISDDAIAEFSEQLFLKDKLVVHTSGSVAMNDLKCTANRGVFYPLQTISKQKKIDFLNIPICLETENEKDYKLLESLANKISKKVYKIDSEQRKNLHVAAVFVNNFVNHLYSIGNDICNKNNVPFEILKPLIKETSVKIKNLSPKESQTGPAKRSDKQTISKHLALLTKNQQKIYTLLTESIQMENINNKF